jgi:hypothetical protein
MGDYAVDMFYFWKTTSKLMKALAKKLSWYYSYLVIIDVHCVCSNDGAVVFLSVSLLDFFKEQLIGAAGLLDSGIEVVRLNSRKYQVSSE